MSILILGTVLALAALGFVLYPLFREGTPVVRRGEARPVREAREPSAAERAVAILREVEFDRETGKLSESDYNTLKSTYTREALAAMRSEDSAAASAGVPDDEIEAVILKYRARPTMCESCGPRPEPDAIYCSSCGRYLAGVCGGCGAKITEVGARFCPACGGSLAA